MDYQKVYCFGEVLFDVYKKQKLPGGAPMNVALHLLRHGKESRIISKIGNDENGAELIAFIQERGGLTDLVQKSTAYETGTVNVKISNKGNASYIINEPVAWDFIDFESPLKDKVKPNDFLVYGSLAVRNQHSFETLIDLLNLNVQKVFDLNLREPHFTYSKIEQLIEKADILKINEDEANVLKALYVPNLEGLESFTTFLLGRFNLKGVLVTLGEHGALANFDSHIYKVNGVKVKVKDTVGSGDSFLAAFISKYIEGLDIEECLLFGCATGAFIATCSGANPEYEVSDIYKLLEQNK